MGRHDENPTCDPLLPPFPVGARIRYIGTDVFRMGRKDKEHTKKPGRPLSEEFMVTVKGPGLVVTIDETRLGRRGTGRTVYLDGDDEGFMDVTRDGCSVYHVGGHGRIIDAEDANEWELVKD